MKTTVIFHSADFDGLFCEAISRKFLPPDTTFIGWNFGDDPLPIPDGQIYVMDLPVDKVFGFEFGPHTTVMQWPAALNRVIWIDHHKSSIDSHPHDLNGYRIDGVAACRLCFQYFTHQLQPKWNGENGERIGNPNLPTKHDFVERIVSEPLAVRLAGEYDIWDKRDSCAEMFQHGLRSQPIDWQLLLKHCQGQAYTESDGYVSKLLAAGQSIAFVRANEYREVITQQGFTVQFEGLTFLACNSHELDIRSQLFEAGIKPEHDAFLGFTFTGKDWRVSMYRIDGKDADILSIAKKYGGGGHQGACGFHINKLPFLP